MKPTSPILEPLFLRLRPGPLAPSGATRGKEIPSNKRRLRHTLTTLALFAALVALPASLQTSAAETDSQLPMPPIWSILEDADQDGMTDVDELLVGMDPFNAEDGLSDFDGDGMEVAWEFAIGTNPFVADTDGDGWSDGEEYLLYGTDPLDPLSLPLGGSPEGGGGKAQGSTAPEPQAVLSSPPLPLLTNGTFEPTEPVTNWNQVSNDSIDYLGGKFQYKVVAVAGWTAYKGTKIEVWKIDVGRNEERGTFIELNCNNNHYGIKQQIKAPVVAGGYVLVWDELGRNNPKSTTNKYHVKIYYEAQGVEVDIAKLSPSRDAATNAWKEAAFAFQITEAQIADAADSPIYVAFIPENNNSFGCFIDDVALLPVDIEPDANMAGVIGNLVKSAKADSKIKHFVTPKTNPPVVGPPEPIDQDYVVLKAVGVTADQITPGHASQIVEWDGGEALVPAEPLKRRVKRDIAAKNEVKIRIKGGGGTAVQMNVWITWADITLENNTPKIQPPLDNGGIYTLNAKILYKYICNPNSMFDTTQDIPDLNVLPNPPAPGGNHPWPPKMPLADGASVRYDATRQVRAILNSSDQVLLEFEREDGFPDIPNFPGDIAEGNDDPNMGGELMPYQGAEGIQGVMRDVDSPKFSLQHVKGLPDSTFSLHAQFRQYARVQIAGKWFRCSDFKLSDLKFKFKKTNGTWGNDGSTFETENGPFPQP